MALSVAKTPRDTWAVYEGTPTARTLGEVAYRNRSWEVEGDPDQRKFLSMFDAIKAVAGDSADGPLQWHLLARGSELLVVFSDSTTLNAIMHEGQWIKVSSELSPEEIEKRIAERKPH